MFQPCLSWVKSENIYYLNSNEPLNSSIHSMMMFPLDDRNHLHTGSNGEKDFECLLREIHTSTLNGTLFSTDEDDETK